MQLNTEPGSELDTSLIAVDIASAALALVLAAAAAGATTLFTGDKHQAVCCAVSQTVRRLQQP